MAANSTPLAGYDTVGLVNGTEIAITDWEVRPEVDDLDGTSTLDGGYYVPYPGRMKGEIHLKGWYDGAANPYAAPFNLIPGNIVADVQIFLDETETSGWDFPTAMVKSAPSRGNIKEKVMFECVLIGSGQFNYPLGQVI